MKKIITVLVVGAILLTIVGCASTDNSSEKTEASDQHFTDNIEPYYEKYNFEYFSTTLRDDISAEDFSKAKDLFERAAALDEQARKNWDELYSMDIYYYSFENVVEPTDDVAISDNDLPKYGEDYGFDSTDISTADFPAPDADYEFTFKEFEDQIRDDVSDEQIEKARQLFDRAIDLGDQAIVLWDELYAMDIYINYELVPVWANLTWDNISSAIRDDISDTQRAEAQKIVEQISELKKDEFKKVLSLFEKLIAMDIFVDEIDDDSPLLGGNYEDPIYYSTDGKSVYP